ncbi:MAG TPA: TolC family protein [Polyangia bacterium]|jgi:outer membrane protein TolC|nr:TolC family protein [Polyangia bacterium]
MKLLDPGFVRRAAAVGAVVGALVVVRPAPAGAVDAEAPQPPEPAPERVTLGEAVSRSLGRNPTVAVALSEIDRADALIKEARAGWYPTLNAFASYTRLDHDRVFAGVVELSANEVAANITLTVPLVSAPAWINTRLAKDNRRIAEASALDVRRQIAQATARAYLTVVAQHRLIAAAETARANAKDHYDYAHTRLMGGVGRSIDEVRAQQDLASVDVQVQATYFALARAREALGVLLATSAPVDSVDEVDLGAMPSLVSALQDAPARRPDIKVLTEKVATAKQASDDTWAFYAPILNLVGQPFIQHPPTTLLPRDGWQAEVLLSLPLYDGGQRTGVSHERDALLAEARANLDAGLRQAQSDVRVSFEEMLRADQGLGSARDAARLAHKAYDLATLAYRAGASTNIEVLDAARQARDADTSTAEAEDLSRQARLDLLVAAGRFP